MGYPSFDVSPWWGYLAPAGTPRAIVDKVNADVAEIAARRPRCRLSSRTRAPSPSSYAGRVPEALEDDVKKWAKIVKSSGARID